MPTFNDGFAHTLSACKDPSDFAYCVCEVYSCGYSQPNRKQISIETLEKGIARADCSSMVSWVLYMGGFLPECPWFYTSIEREYLQEHDFTELECGVFAPQRNDVLWRSGHTAIYIGDGLVAELIHDENNDAGWEGEKAGDQTDDESRIIHYDSSKWEYILRLPHEDIPESEVDEMTFTFHIDGDTGKPMQFCDGTRVRGIKDLHELGELRHAYRQATGKDLQHVEGLTQKFIDVMNR